MAKTSAKDASNSIYLQNFEHKKKLNGAVDKLALEKLRTFSDGETEIERRENALTWAKNLKSHARRSMLRKVELRRDKDIDRDLVYELTEAENLSLLKEVDWVYHGNFYPADVAHKHPETAFSITTYVVEDEDYDDLFDDEDDDLLEDLEYEESSHLMYMASYGYIGGNSKGGYSSYIYAATLDEAIEFITSEFKSTGWNSAFDRVVSYNLKRQQEKYAKKNPRKKNRGSHGGMPEDVYREVLSKIQQQTANKLQREAWNNPNIKRVVSTINKASDTATLYDTCDRFLVELAKKWLREARERDQEEKKARRLSDDNIIDLDKETPIEESFPVAISPSVVSQSLDDEVEDPASSVVGNVSSTDSLSVGGGVGRSKAARDIDGTTQDESALITHINNKNDDSEEDIQISDMVEADDTQNDSQIGSSSSIIEIENEDEEQVPENSSQIREEATRLIEVPSTLKDEDTRKRTEAPILKDTIPSRNEISEEEERRQREEEERRQREEEERRKREEEERRKREEERKQREEEQRKQREEEERRQREEAERIRAEIEARLIEEKRLREEAERKAEEERKIRKKLEHSSRINEEKDVLYKHFKFNNSLLKDNFTNINKLYSGMETSFLNWLEDEKSYRREREEEKERMITERRNNFKNISESFKNSYTLFTTNRMLADIGVKNLLSSVIQEKESFSLDDLKTQKENKIAFAKKREDFKRLINNNYSQKSLASISSIISRDSTNSLEDFYLIDLQRKYSNFSRKFKEEKLDRESQRTFESQEVELSGLLSEIGVDDTTTEISKIKSLLPELFDITRYPVKVHNDSDVNEILDSLL